MVFLVTDPPRGRPIGAAAFIIAYRKKGTSSKIASEKQ
jgi:hypothetical protein